MKTPKDYIIFPLDVPTVSEAARYIELLSESVGIFKGCPYCVITCRMTLDASEIRIQALRAEYSEL